jgi:hypothetical protein
MKAGVVLLALLLATMVMVPMVNAEKSSSDVTESKNLIESNYIPIKTAQDHATITMLDMIQSGALNENWVGAKLNPEPLIIYDLNGQKLFYLFPVEKKGERVGEIYAASSKVLGAPVVVIGSITDPKKIKSLELSEQTIVNKKYNGFQIISSKLVCYDYPLIGLITTLKNQDTGEEKYILIDPRDGSDQEFDQLAQSNHSKIYSYYDQISLEDMKIWVNTWNDNDKKLKKIETELFKKDPEIFVNYPDMDISKIDQIISNIKNSNDPTIRSLFLQDDQRIISGLTHSTQYTDVWCGVATAQIISSKYMSEDDLWSQYHIADMMGAYYPNGTPKGTTLSGELNYYSVSVANGGLGKSSSSWADRPYTTWEAAHDEIENNRPLKIGRDSPNYHARACAGWMVNGGNPYLLFYDPGQWGSIYFEYVAPGYTYNNFMYVR